VLANWCTTHSGSPNAVVRGIWSLFVHQGNAHAKRTIIKNQGIPFFYLFQGSGILKESDVNRPVAVVAVLRLTEDNTPEVKELALSTHLQIGKLIGLAERK
jgi:hypothetical protein